MASQQFVNPKTGISFNHKLVKGTFCHLCKKRLAVGFFNYGDSKGIQPACSKCINTLSRQMHKYNLEDKRYITIT